MKYYFYILFGLLPGLIFAASSDEQVKQTIAKIYQLEKSFDKLNRGSEDEEIIKKDFKGIIVQLTTGKLLSRWEDFIANTPIRSTFYRTVFESMTPVGSFDVKSIDTSGSRSKVKIILNISELYAPSIDMITLDELYAKYKITNLSIPEVIGQLPTSSLAELVEYRIVSKREDTHNLKFVNGAWKIASIEQKILSSTISVNIPDKK